MKTYTFGNKKERLLNKIGATILLSVAFFSPANALQLRFPNGTHDVEVLALGTMENRPSESKIDFLKRVGRVLEMFTAQNNYEACGNLGERKHLNDFEEGKWSVTLLTQESHIACGGMSLFPNDVSDTKTTIHSHPNVINNRTYKINKSDAAFLNYLGTTTRYKVGQRGNYPFKNQSYNFSEQDLKHDNGYLVVNGTLYEHQGSSKSILNHGNIAPTDEYLHMFGSNIGLLAHVPVRNQNIKIITVEPTLKSQETFSIAANKK